MGGRYVVTIRREGVTDKLRFTERDEALDALERELRVLAGVQRGGEARRTLLRDYDPIELVAARGEISGGGLRGGVDVRADGSAEAFTGRIRRRLIEPEPGESAYSALRRVL